MSSMSVHDVRPVTEREAEVYVASTCFKTGPPGCLGVEVERLVYDAQDPRLPVPASRVDQALSPVRGRLPRGGRITLEPGGQAELSSACAPGLPALVAATRADLALVDSALTSAGLRPGVDALDSVRPPRRSLDQPRYAAMERYFDRLGTVGRVMMCSTSAVQVCVNAGYDGAGPRSAPVRWRRLHSLLPVLIAMFANSPFRDGRPNGWVSNRQRVWRALDPQRTGPPSTEGDPRAAWASYALDAHVLCIRQEDPSASWEAPSGLTMRSWLRGAGPRPAGRDDLDYHISTLFPPVRPRGFLEVRVIDAQPGGDWEVAVAVVSALMDDDRAACLAAEACAGLDDLPDPMTAAARQGLRCPPLAAAARLCAEAAEDALPRLGADEHTRRRVNGFVNRYPAVGRMPADDRLDHFHRTGQVSPFGPQETP